MTADEARAIVLGVLDAHLDARALARGKTVTERQREAGRAAMGALFARKGVDFESMASRFEPADLRRAVEALLRAGLS